MKLPYSEGSAFLVPLRGGGNARGVVARARPRGKILFGYFFGPRLAPDAAVSLNDCDPAKAILRVQFGDLGLISGEWPVLGKLPAWDRTEWPMPDFARRDPLRRLKTFLVRYSDDDPSKIQDEYPIDDDSGLPTDSLYGSGAVEINLTRLLA
jgi:hypothetical protein